MTTTNNGLTVEELNGDTWIECACGASDWLSKLNESVLDKGQLRHRSSCRTRAQHVVATAQTEIVAQTTEIRRAELETFACNVRKYGLTKGRDQDVLEAVRAGLLSESDAMNTDD